MTILDKLKKTNYEELPLVLEKEYRIYILLSMKFIKDAVVDNPTPEQMQEISNGILKIVNLMIYDRTASHLTCDEIKIVKEHFIKTFSFYRNNNSYKRDILTFADRFTKEWWNVRQQACYLEI